MKGVALALLFILPAGMEFKHYLAKLAAQGKPDKESSIGKNACVILVERMHLCFAP